MNNLQEENEYHDILKKPNLLDNNTEIKEGGCFVMGFVLIIFSAIWVWGFIDIIRYLIG